ncbi:MAG: DUF5668 domain-containing protein [Treponemataceae bacterium]|nr:DUF5668 domain-containing protein [Treponemataceae bacterium]
MYAGKKSQEIILGSGIFLITIGIALICLFVLDIQPNMLITIPCAVMLLGAVFLFLAYIRKKVVWLFFLGFFLASGGVFSLIICFGSFNYSMTHLWPVLVILCGLSYCGAYFHVFHRFSIPSVVPSLVLIGFGGFLLCFSLGIIQIPFRKFISRFWPLFLVLLGIVFIIIYAYMQHTDMSGKSENEVIADGNGDD